MALNFKVPLGLSSPGVLGLPILRPSRGIGVLDVGSRVCFGVRRPLALLSRLVTPEVIVNFGRLVRGVGLGV
jgi:hypothetical protein